MKKVIVITAFLFTGLLVQSVKAQVHIGLNVNIGNQPVWGPVGYDHVDYYYMPDIDAYYYVPTRQYIYQERGRWTFASSLPSRFHYDLYSGYKVVVNEPKPYLRNNVYRAKYAGYKGRHDQQIIRNSHDSRYFEIKDHPEHNKWKSNNNTNNHNNNDHNNGNDHRNDRHHN